MKFLIKVMLVLLLVVVIIFQINSFDVSAEEQEPQVSYTPVSKTVCEGRVCNTAIYNRVSFAFEDSIWKHINDARSLKGSGIKVHIEQDERYPVQVIDYNLTSITIRLEKKTLSSVPIRVLEKIRLDDLTIVKNQKLRRELAFEDKSEKEIVLEFGFDKEVHIGENSTVITFGTTIGEGFVKYEALSDWNLTRNATSGTEVGGTVAVEAVYGNLPSTYKINRAFIPINTTSLPENIIILNASWNGYATSKSNDEDDGQDFIVVVGNSTQFSLFSLNESDYNKTSSLDNPFEMSERLDIGDDISLSAYTAFPLTDVGISSINPGGITRFALREGHDVVNDFFPKVNGRRNHVYFAEDGSANPSYLNVTYQLPSLEILEIIPIQVVEGVDMVLGKTGLVRIVVHNNANQSIDAIANVTFEGALLYDWDTSSQTSLTSNISPGNNVSFDFKFIPTQTGTQTFTAQVEEEE